MTSSDAVDTGVALQMRDSLQIIIDDVKMLLESIKKEQMNINILLWLEEAMVFMESQ